MASMTAKPKMESLGLLQLSIEDRIILAQELLDSIPDPEQAFELSEAEKNEVRRRLADHLANPGSGLTRDELNAQLKANRAKSK